MRTEPSYRKILRQGLLSCSRAATPKLLLDKAKTGRDSCEVIIPVRRMWSEPSSALKCALFVIVPGPLATLLSCHLREFPPQELPPSRLMSLMFFLRTASQYTAIDFWTFWLGRYWFWFLLLLFTTNYVSIRLGMKNVVFYNIGFPTLKTIRYVLVGVAQWLKHQPGRERERELFLKSIFYFTSF